MSIVPSNRLHLGLTSNTESNVVPLLTEVGLKDGLESLQRGESVVSIGNRDPIVDLENSLLGERSITIKGREPCTLDQSNTMLRHAPPANLFPLLLTPIDRFFQADDSARFPMTSIIHMDFTGQVDVEAFKESLDDALVRHPLLGALVQKAKRGLTCWIPALDQEPRIDVGPADKPIDLQGPEGFDLSRDLGVRFWIRKSAASSRVTIQVHHACTDGTGVYRFLGDLWALYGIRKTTIGRSPSLGNIDWKLLRSRRRRMTDLANKEHQRLEYMRQGLKQAWRVFGSCVQPLARPDGRQESATPLSEFPGIATFTLPKEQHEELRGFAARQGAMLNDLLMAEMFRTIVRWNAHHGQLSQRRWIRIMMPSDLRSTEDYDMPATNMTAYTFLAQKPRDCQNVASLLQSIRAETGQIKHERLGTRFADAVALAEHGQRFFAFLLSRKWCMATAILSNVGDPSRRFTARFPRENGKVVCGNLTLEGVSGVPPLRTQTHATLAVFTYLRKLTISVRCNPYLFDASATQAFLDMYEEGLLSYLAQNKSESN